VLVVRFDHPLAGETAVAGGKGASLSRMAGAGLPVPPGFVVCAATFRDFLDCHDGGDLIGHATRDLDVHADAALQRASEQIRRLILSNPLAEVTQQAIRSAYLELGTTSLETGAPTTATPTTGALVAVRSSAVSEDGEAASFAGQQETFLSLRGADAVLHAVRECWASFFTPRAMFYRAQKGVLADVQMAVVVQEMVRAEKSGVMFTADPIHKQPGHMVIEAVFGLGEGIVSGMLTPDHYVIDRNDGSMVREFIAMQLRAVVHDENGGGTAERELSEEEGSARVLDQEALEGLRQAGLRLEEFFGKPQDVEWCIRKGEMFLLQSRPITTL
jgi:pyruvate,water dikinase